MQFNWTFPVQVVFGVGKFQSASKHIKGFGKKAFIVTSDSFINGPRKEILDHLTSQLKRINVEYEVFGKIEPNPRHSTIDEAGKKIKDFHAHYVIALGGGSVMDAAKCISLLAENDGQIYEYAYKGTGKEMRHAQNALPLVCIPTVAATSSETDSYAVITNLETERKVTVFGNHLLPKMAIIDPELTYSVPAKQTVDGAIDMITHVMETYLSTPKPALIQDQMTEAFVETVVRSLPRVLENPKDADGRSNLSWCGALALSGVLSGRDGAWPIHAIEHGLSAVTDVAHGRGLALLLPRVMRFDAPVISEKLIHFNRKIFDVQNVSDPLKSLELGFETFMKKVGAWTKFDEILKPGKKREEIIQKTLDHTFEVSGVFKKGEEPYLDNIVPMNRNQVLQILQATF